MASAFPIVGPLASRAFSGNVVLNTVGRPMIRLGAPITTPFMMAIDRHNQENPENRISHLYHYDVRVSRPVRISQKEENKKNKILRSITNPMKRSYRRRQTNKKPRSARKKTTVPRPVRKFRKRLSDGFPKTTLVRLKAVHQAVLDPAASSTPAYCSLSCNNPIDPFDVSDSNGFSLTSTEHHQKLWDVYEKVYENFEVVGFKVNVKLLNPNQQLSVALFGVFGNTNNKAEIKSIIQESVTGATRLKEEVKHATVIYHTGASTQSRAIYNITKKVNIRKLEDASKDHTSLVGYTSASNSETAPTATPRCYIGLTPLVASQDVTGFTAIISTEYIIKFSGLPDLAGVAV